MSKQVEAVNSLRTMTTADLDEHLRQLAALGGRRRLEAILRRASR